MKDGEQVKERARNVHTTSVKTPPSRPKILVAEDEAVLRDTYEIILCTEPYDVDVAHDGKEAFEKCRNTRYDLILLDIMMPRMSGIDFLESAQRVDIGTPTIIVLSNLSSGIEIEKALNLGASTNVLKSSLSPRQLLALVENEVKQLR